MYARLAIFLVLICACESGYEEERQAIHADTWLASVEAQALSSDFDTRLHLIRTMPLRIDALSRIDSLLTLGPSIRHYNDVLARIDSTVYADLHIYYVSYLYYEIDTVASALRYYDALPWLAAYGVEIQVDQMRMFAETLGDAIHVTQSSNMARQAYQAFVQVEQLAIATGDSTLIRHVYTSMEKVAADLQVLPDSVKNAFAPSLVEAPQAWGLIVSTVIMGLVFAGGVWRLGRRREKQQAEEAVES